MDNHLKWLKLLKPCGELYALLGKLREYVLKRKQTAFPIPVLSIGNISMGGTGKTPFCLYLANSLQLKTVILTRGYKAKPPYYPFKVPKNASPLICGDEPLLLAKHSPAKVIIDPNRLRAAQYALKKLKPDLFILDDGFGQIKIKKDLDIVIFSPKDFYYWNQVIPSGMWREGKNALYRADLFLISLQGQDKNTLLPLIEKKLAPFKKIFLFFDYKPSFLQSSLTHKKTRTLQKYILITSLANPQKITLALSKFLGTDPKKHFKFSDHYNFTSKDLKRIVNTARGHNASLVCTQKEIDKIKAIDPKQEFWVLHSKISFSTEEEKYIFWKIIGEKLNEKNKTSRYFKDI
ncbi:tetraacyldisaccharide 4'-kinase [Desulfonauticus submarinus]